MARRMRVDPLSVRRHTDPSARATPSVSALAIEVANERKGAKRPFGLSEDASRWELLGALEVAYGLIAGASASGRSG